MHMDRHVHMGMHLPLGLQVLPALSEVDALLKQVARSAWLVQRSA